MTCRRALLAPLLASGLVALVGCHQAEEVPRFEDLVAAGALTSTLDGGEAKQLPCADETIFSRPLRPGEELSAAVDFGDAPRLLVSGCLAGAPATAPGTAGGAVAGTLELVAEVAGDPGGPALRESLPMGDGASWWRREIDLGPGGDYGDFSRHAGSLRVVAHPPAGGGTFLLRDLVLEHRLPAPSGPPSRTGGPRPPQVLLISVDTLRADFIGALGGEAATPAFDRLAADGEVFTHHYATAGWTKPSHAGLLTGEPAAVHRVAGADDRIDPVATTLAERFRRAGFLTAGIVHDCVWLNAKFGFSRGFDSYRSVKWGAAPIARAAADWMAGHRDQPFFFFLHTFDVHSDFTVLPYEGPGVTRATVAERFGVAGYGCRWGRCASDLLEEIDRGHVAPIPGEGDILRFLYGKGVEGVDAALGRLLAALDAAGLYDGMLIAVTSDHGESLLEHGRTTHGNWWQQVVRVPLIVKWPRGAGSGAPGGRREAPTSALDVAPTLLAAAGVAADDLPGADLRSRAPDRPAVVENGWHAIVVGSWKGVADVEGSGPQLYDLAADPGEAVNLIDQRPEVARLLASRLADYLAAGERRAARLRGAAATVPNAMPLSDEERERLRALGYLGGGS